MRRLAVLFALLLLLLTGIGFCTFRPAPLGLAEPGLSSGTPFGEDQVVAQGAITARLTCDLPRPTANAVVHAVSVYRGAGRTPIQIHFTETREIDLFVTEQGAPVLLVLASHDAVIWKLRIHPKARLAGIVLVGYDDQIVVGAPSSVTVASRVYGMHQCDDAAGLTLISVAGRVERDDLEALVKDAFDRALQSLQTARTGDAFWIGPKVELPKSALDAYPFVVPANAADTHRPILFGRPALARLVKEGVIRPARLQDIDSWRSVGANKSGPRNLLTDLDLERTYVVNGFFQLPLGLTGDASSAFIVPASVTIPKGFVGQNLILTFRPYGCHWFEGFSVNCIGIPDPRFRGQSGN